MYTSSRLRVLRECLRKHYYRYGLGIQTPSTPQMEFGTVAHSAMEAYFLAWKRGDLDGRLASALGAIEASVADKYSRAKLRALLIGYHTRWGSKNWTILEVEVEFRYALGEYLIGGKIDAIVRDEDSGRVYILEHKTTNRDASIGSGYWDALALDVQVSIYIDGATMLGYDVAGVIYDVLQRPRHDVRLATPADQRKYTLGKGCSACGGSAGGKKGIVQGRGYTNVVFASEVKQPECSACRGTGWKCDDEGNPQAPRLHANQRDRDETIDELEDRIVESIAEAPDDYLIRGVVVRLEDELPRMRQDIEDAIKLERASALFNLMPRNPDSCARFGSLCHFYDVCSSRASIDDETRFPRGTAHPELAAA